MPLRTRKIIYMALALVGCIVWLPASVAAIPAMGIGIFGLIALSALLRGISVLPVARQVRSYYSIPIGMGVFVMGGYIAILVSIPEFLQELMIAVIAGAMLFAVGTAVLVEMYVAPEPDDEDRAIEAAPSPDGIPSQQTSARQRDAG